MELLRITRQIHCKDVEQRATLIHTQYNRDWGTSYSRPPIDPYLTSPLLQNPGGATDARCRCRRASCRHCDMQWDDGTGVNPAGDAGDTPPIFWLGGRQWEYPPPILLRTFGYSRPILVALRSLSLKPIPFDYKTPPIRFSQAGGQSAHKARPPNLELALTPLDDGPVCWRQMPSMQ